MSQVPAPAPAGENRDEEFESPIGLFFPTMVVAGNLAIMIGLILLVTRSWITLGVMSACVAAGSAFLFGYRFRPKKPTREDTP